jgi:hypothetical protein
MVWRRVILVKGLEGQVSPDCYSAVGEIVASGYP